MSTWTLTLPDKKSALALGIRLLDANGFRFFYISFSVRSSFVTCILYRLLSRHNVRLKIDCDAVSPVILCHSSIVTRTKAKASFRYPTHSSFVQFAELCSLHRWPSSYANVLDRLITMYLLLRSVDLFDLFVRRCLMACICVWSDDDLSNNRRLIIIIIIRWNINSWNKSFFNNSQRFSFTVAMTVEPFLYFLFQFCFDELTAVFEVLHNFETIYASNHLWPVTNPNIQNKRKLQMFFSVTERICPLRLAVTSLCSKNNKK